MTDGSGTLVGRIKRSAGLSLGAWWGHSVEYVLYFGARHVLLFGTAQWWAIRAFLDWRIEVRNYWKDKAERDRRRGAD